MGILSVFGLDTKDRRTTGFVVEVYSDSGYTTLVDTGTAPAVWDSSNRLSKMLGVIRFRTLVTGTTYYLRSAGFIQEYGGVSDWVTYSAAAGADTSQAVIFGSGPPSGSADEGEIYFDTSGTSYVMYVYHTGAWHSIFGSGVGTAGGGVFTSGSNSNGYWVQDPAGHLHQWGFAPGGSNPQSVTFPTAFSSATGVVVTCTPKNYGTGATRNDVYLTGAPTTTGFSAQTDSSSCAFSWTADGPGVASSSSVLVDPSTTEGDMLYRHSGALARLPIGTAGQVLTVVGGDPAWTTPSSSGSGTHAEPICDINGPVLQTNGDVIMLLGVPN